MKHQHITTILGLAMMIVFLLINSSVLAQKWKKVKPDVLYAEPDKSGSKSSSSNDTIPEIRVGIGTSSPLMRLHVTGDGSNTATFMSGNVGIGTTSPSEKLSVSGTIESTLGGIKFPDGSYQIRSEERSAGNNGRFRGSQER